MPRDATFLHLIAWRVVTAFEERGWLNDRDIADLRELAVEYGLSGRAS